MVESKITEALKVSNLVIETHFMKINCIENIIKF